MLGVGLSVVGDLDLKVFRAGATDGVPNSDESFARIIGVGAGAAFVVAVLSVAIEEFACVGRLEACHGAELVKDSPTLGARG